MSADTEPADHAVLLLQRTRELLLDCREAVEQLGASPAHQATSRRPQRGSASPTGSSSPLLKRAS